MKPDRMVRVNRLMKETLAQVLPQVKDPRVTRPVVLSVIDARTSPDLRHCKVYLSISGTPEEQQAALAGLGRAAGFVRAEVGQAVRLRQLPELQFFLDESIETGARVEQILRELAAESHEHEREHDEGGDRGEHDDDREQHQDSDEAAGKPGPHP